MPELKITPKHLEHDAYLYIRQSTPRQVFRWFVGMNLDEPVWDVTVFTKNRNRLLEGDVAREFLVRGGEASSGQEPDQ